MGNEHSKNNELTQNGKIPEKHKSGSVNGLSANITMNGLDIEVNGETIVQQNGGTHSLKLTESSESDYVVIESKCQQADAPVISEILETTIQKEEVKKSKEEKVNVFDKMFKKKAGPPAHVNNVKEKETSGEDQTDVSLPAIDPQPESGSSGDEATAMNVAEHGEDSDNLRRKAETSTQTDGKTEADISTQTGFDGDDDDTTTNTEGPVEEVIRMETAATEEDPLNESAVVIIEEAADETTHQEPFENQTPGMIINEVTITENNEYEDTVFRAEQVEVSDTFGIDPIKNCDPEDESVNETEPEAAAESESNTNKDIIEGQAAEEENNVEQTVPLEISVSLLKAVPDCVEVDVAAVCEHADVVAADIPEPSVEEVFTGVELIETVEPKSNAVTPEAEEINGVPSPDEEPVISVMEAISEVVCEEPDSIVATQGMSAEELSLPLVTEILVKVEPALEEDTAADAVAVTDAPGKSVEFITLEAPFNELTTIEELPEDAFSSPEDEVSLDSIPEVITSDVSAQVTEEMIADVAPETVAEENNVEETVPLEISASLPKVVAECVEAVLAAVSEPTDFAATNTSEPSVEEVITEDNSGATDMSAEEELIETVEHESNAVTPEETVPLEISASLPKLVAECVEAVLAAVSEPTDFAATNTSEPSVEEVITEDNSGATDMSAEEELIETVEHESNAVTPEETVPLEISASLLKVVPDCVEVDVAAVCEYTDVAAADIPEPSVEEVFPGVELIETAEPKSNAVTPEAKETNGIPSQEEEPVTTVMETISEVVCEEPNPIVANQGMSAEELSVPLKVEAAHKGVTADNAVAVNDVSGISEEYITVEAPSTIKELPEDTLNSPDVEVKSASIPEVITTDESPEVTEDVIADVGPETVEEAEPSPVIIKDDAEVIPEVAIDALSQEFDLSSIIPHEATMDNDIALEEEVISAITFVPLSGEREINFTIPEEPSKRAAKDMNEEAIEALSNQLEAVPESAEEDAIVQEPSTRGQATGDASSEEHVEENTEMIADTSVTSTDMEALLVRLQSACTSTVEESAFRFEGMKETANLKQKSESLTEPESVTVDPSPEGEKAPEADNGNSQPVETQEDSHPEENPVMNFFKTLVTSTKTAKKETATPDATKDQSQKESQPAATTTVAQVCEPPAAPKGMSIPPPPPPEPPKMEIKGEPAAKPAKPIPKEEPKAAAKAPESSKGKSAKDTLSKFFRPKVLLGVKASKGKGASAGGASAPGKTAAVTIKEVPQPAVEVEVQPVVEVQETPVDVPVVEVQRENNVEPHETAENVAQLVVGEQMVEQAQPVVEAEKVDPSKTGTLEAAPKPEPAPPVQEEKKTASKSAFLSFFKPKAADPKKAAPAPTAAAEASQTVKAKEEPKAAAKSSEAAVDSKPASAASQAVDDAASGPRKLEKRNSIQMFFKILGQKRNSTDAGVQTEPVTVAPAAEKAK